MVEETTLRAMGARLKVSQAAVFVFVLNYMLPTLAWGFHGVPTFPNEANSLSGLFVSEPWDGRLGHTSSCFLSGSCCPYLLTHSLGNLNTRVPDLVFSRSPLKTIDLTMHMITYRFTGKQTNAI